MGKYHYFQTNQLVVAFINLFVWLIVEHVPTQDFNFLSFKSAKKHSIEGTLTLAVKKIE